MVMMKSYKRLKHIAVTAATILMALCGTVATTSCEKVENEYCTYTCYYVMDFQYGFTTSYLNTALTSSGNFAIISVSPYGSGNAYKLQSEIYGTTAREDPVTIEILTKPTRQLGLNNGLVVGLSPFQDNALYVFDRQCPNCYNESQRPNHALSFKDVHNMYCSNCKRTYGLLNGGVVVSGDSGEKMFRYHATFVGQRFTVANPQ